MRIVHARGSAAHGYFEACQPMTAFVGNDIPVFLIHDAMKFPDLVHAVKPEPHHGKPHRPTTPSGTSPR